MANTYSFYCLCKYTFKNCLDKKRNHGKLPIRVDFIPERKHPVSETNFILWMTGPDRRLPLLSWRREVGGGGGAGHDLLCYGWKVQKAGGYAIPPGLAEAVPRQAIENCSLWTPLQVGGPDQMTVSQSEGWHRSPLSPHPSSLCYDICIKEQNLRPNITSLILTTAEETTPFFKLLIQGIFTSSTERVRPALWSTHAVSVVSPDGLPPAGHLHRSQSE